MEIPGEDKTGHTTPPTRNPGKPPRKGRRSTVRAAGRGYSPRLGAVGILTGLVVLWHLVSRSGWVPAFILPGPLQILDTLWTQRDVLSRHALTTLGVAAGGLVLSVSLALVLSMIMDALPLVRDSLYPLVLGSQMVPLIALAPLFILWFGFGMAPRIIVVVLVCFFPVLLSLLQGFRGVGQNRIRLLQSMGAGKLQIFWVVKLPGALISLFAGMKIAVTYSVMGAVIGEWLGGSKGLGVYLIRSQKSFAVERVFAAIGVIIVLSMVLYGLTALIQRMVMPWMGTNDE
ncbi:ABC transporter permease [Spirochaeta lutea]|uniref:ABC transporter permease n=1 Tax=Spirochaeta lutea TaxID=1480694 RepID=UPI0009E0B171|nr:ABC transporter permease [Spirochaeta lutea]